LSEDWERRAFARRSFICKENTMATPPRRDAPRTVDGASQIWQNRTDMVKQELAAANKAADAKTARLKALRLEKEAQDAEAARLEAANAPAKPGKRGG